LRRLDKAPDRQAEQEHAADDERRPTPRKELDLVQQVGEIALVDEARDAVNCFGRAVDVFCECIALLIVKLVGGAADGGANVGDLRGGAGFLFVDQALAAHAQPLRQRIRLLGGLLAELTKIFAKGAADMRRPAPRSARPAA